MSRYYCFTINNPTKPPKVVNVRYCVYQLECGEETKTPHFQGYLELNKPQRVSWLKKNFSKKAHYEIRLGTREQARAYCMKEESRLEGPFEFGEMGSQGERNDLKLLVGTIKSGVGMKGIIETHPKECAKYLKFVDRVRELYAPRRDWITECHVFWGKPNTGKSRKCWELAPNAFPKDHTKWWNGYDGDENVIIEDYEGELDFRYLLRLLDRYPMMVETKGGYVAFLAKKVYINSNVHPKKWYPDKSDWKALERRLTSCNEVVG